MADKEDNARKKLKEIVEGSEDKDDPKDQDILGLGKIGKRLTAEEKIKFLSNIGETTVQNFSILYAINTQLNSPLLSSFLDNNLTLKVSQKGRGREDLIELAKSLAMPMAFMMGGEDTFTQKTGFIKKLKDKV